MPRHRHPELATYVPNIGDSYEGRPIPAMIIGGTDGGPAVYLQSEIHAREWICPSTAMFIIVEMLESDDAELRRLVELMRFVIIPVANPDGYA